MIIEQLKEKHEQTSDFFNDNGIEQETIDHTNISIQFAIEQLQLLMYAGTEHFAVSNIDIEDKINELKSQIQ